MELHRGRLIDHVQLVVSDFDASKRFYLAIFDVLGIAIGGEGPEYFWADELIVSTPSAAVSLGHPTGRMHLAFQAQSPAMVDRFYAAGLAAGGRDNGKPGLRAYHPGYYAAFLFDPAGNNVEVVHHGPAQRSAESIEITF